MSRKHAHRADNRPVTRRYVRSVVQRARDDILRAIVNASLLIDPDLDLSRFDRTHIYGDSPKPIRSGMVTFSTADESHVWADMDRTHIYGDSPMASIGRIERAVNGTKEN